MVLQQPGNEAFYNGRREKTEAEKQKKRNREQAKKEQQKDKYKKDKNDNAGKAPVSTRSKRVR